MPRGGTSPWTDLARPPLRPDALRRALLPPAGGFARVEVLPSVPSTNAEMASQAGSGGWPDLSVLTTDDQTAGRGRLGRSWATPPRAAVAASVLLRPGPEAAAETWAWLPLLGGLAVVQALRSVVGLDATLKWPNDVLVPSEPHGLMPQKVCGVLAQVVDTPEGAAVVLGLGVNVLQLRDELPVGTSTSVRLAGGATTDRATVLLACLRSLLRLYRAWKDAAGDASSCGLRAAVQEACSTLGGSVRVRMPGTTDDLTGVAEGLDGAGRLLLRLSGEASGEGGLLPVAAGDVVHLRPDGQLAEDPG